MPEPVSAPTGKIAAPTSAGPSAAAPAPTGRVRESTDKESWPCNHTITFRIDTDDPQFQSIARWAIVKVSILSHHPIAETLYSPEVIIKMETPENAAGMTNLSTLNGFIVSALVRIKFPGYARNARGTARNNSEMWHVALHELGHMIGLEHQSDQSSIMYPTVNEVQDYSFGDMQQLDLIGNYNC